MKQLPKYLAILTVFILFGVLAYFYLERVHILGLISLYGAISVGRIVFQVITALLVRRRQLPPLPHSPLATVIVAVFNENKDAFTACLRSLNAQTYPNLDIIVIDDGSDNADEIQAITRTHGARYERITHAGKREAMYHGFTVMSPATQYVLTADSDTIWHKHAATHLVTAVSQPNVGAATGLVDTTNTNTNFLTKLIHMRYFMAFEQERASQSIFGTVTCVSGPLGAYRRDVIDRIKEPFITQTFFGRKCTFGDDRHLTNLVLGLGYKVVYSKAVAYTDAPTTLRQYIKQQARWGKSHWREMLWQLKALPKQHLYLTVDWCVSLVLPFLLVLSIGHYAYLAVTDTGFHMVTLIGTIILMSFLRVIEPIRQTRDFRFLYFVFYSFFHLFVLLPLKFYSLATVNVSGWGTRKKLA